MKNIVLPVLVLSAFTAINLHAITLKEALTESLTTNPVILERLKNYDKTVYDLKIARSEYAPSIDFTGRYGYEKTLDGPNSVVGYHTYRNTLNLTQNLFKGYGSVYRVKYEKARVMAAAYNYVEKTNDVAFNIVKEYLNVIKFNSLYKLEKENVFLTQDILRKTEELSDAGSGLLSDVKKVNSSLQLAEFNFLTQENNLMDSEYNLGKLLGKRVDHFTLETPVFKGELPKTINDATTHAIEFNPSIIVTNYNISTAKSALVQARSKFSPTIDFEFDYNFDKNTDGQKGHDRSYSALLVYKQNLFKGNADINLVRKNKLNIQQEYETQREIRRQIIEGLQLSWTAYTMIEKQLVFLNSYKEESKATLDLYREEFEDGTRTLIDLLSAQDDYISSRSKYITAKFDGLFSKYRVLDSMGEMINTLFSQQSSQFYLPTTAHKERVSSFHLDTKHDTDNDNVLDLKDHCDNTTLGFEVDILGCDKNSKEVVNLPVTNSIEIIENIEIQKESDLKDLSFKDEFINSNAGFTLNLATFSTQKSVDKFLDESKLGDNYMTFTYLTPKSQKKRIKVVSGLYETKKDALAALSKLPRIVKINKPYLDNLNKVKDLYIKFN
jgi:adhesin transport system outer membrane protein